MMERELETSEFVTNVDSDAFLEGNDGSSWVQTQLSSTYKYEVGRS